MWLKILVCPFVLGDEKKCIYAVTDVTQEHNDREKIAAAVVAAEQANAAKSSFFSSMSHDMRTPMNGIVGMTAIAKRCLGDPDGCWTASIRSISPPGICSASSTMCWI